MYKNGIISGLVFLGALFFTFPAQGVDVKIGNHGTKISLPQGWSQRIQGLNLGKHQFNYRNKLFIVVFEIEGPLESKEDFLRFLNERDSLLRVHKNYSSTKPVFQMDKRLKKAYIDIRVKYQGINLFYRLLILGQDGLNYFFMFWCTPSDKTKMLAEVNNITSTLQYPSKDGAWYQKIKPTPDYVVTPNGYKFKFTYPKAIFTPIADMDDSFYSLLTKTDVCTSHNFLSKTDMSIEEFIESVKSTLEPDFPNIKEKKRKKVSFADLNGYQVIFDSKEISAVSTVLKVKPDLFYENRFIVLPPLKDKMKYLDGLLKNLEIKAPPEITAYPEATAAADNEPTPMTLGPGERALLKSAKLRGEYPSQPPVNSLQYLPSSKSLLLTCAKTARLWSLGSENMKTLYTTDTPYYGRSYVFNPPNLYLTGDGDTVFCHSESKTKELPFKAYEIAPFDNQSFLLFRSLESKILPSVRHHFPCSRSQLIKRDYTGKEMVLSEFNGFIWHIAACAARNRILVVSKSTWRDKDGENSDLKAEIHDLKTEKRITLPGWANITHVASSEVGWLVNGQPRNGKEGLYSVGVDGKRQLLISGNNFTGVYLSGQELLVTSELKLPRAKDKQKAQKKYYLYAIPLKVALAKGNQCQPFSSKLIQRIAEETFKTTGMALSDEGLLSSKKDLDIFFKAAGEASKKQVGSPLPVGGNKFDSILGDLDDRKHLKAEGKVLLTVWLAQMLLRNDAEWIDSSSSCLASLNHCEYPSQNDAFCFSIVPGEVIMSSLYDSEGYWRPVSTIKSMAAGRKVLIGNSRTSIEKHRSCGEIKELKSLLAGGDSKAISSFLLKHKKNNYLRKLVYAEMIMNNQLSLLEEVGEVFWQKNDPELQDLHINLAIKVKNKQQKGEELIDDLFTAIRKYPFDASFYFLLAKTYENSEVDLATEKALKCYNKAMDLYSSPKMKEDIVTGLARCQAKLTSKPTDAQVKLKVEEKELRKQ